MTTLVSIVEGEGEVRALPVLLRRLAESLRNAKGWLSERMQIGRYHEVSDQPAMCALFDIDEALTGSRSFRKFVKECNAAFGVAEP